MKKFSLLLITLISLSSSLYSGMQREGFWNGERNESSSEERLSNDFPKDHVEPISKRNDIRSGPARIKNFYMKTLTEKGKVVYAAPGMQIQAFAQYSLDRGKDGSINQIIVGYDKGGAQKAIYNGGTIDKGMVNFTLTAPSEPGIYEVRFRPAQAYSGPEAVKYWWNVDGAPTEQTTIGLVIVDEFYGQQASDRKITNQNFDEYMATKYSASGQLPKSVQIITKLDNRFFDQSDFWGVRDGKWMIGEKVITGLATPSWNTKYHIDSHDAYKDVDLVVTTKHRVVNPPRGWSYARGYDISYYVDDKHHVTFHYFPDVKKASLYIYDKEKTAEYIETLYLSEYEDHTHHIVIEDGSIYWSINGVVLFDGKKTSLNAGRLRLTTSNNDTQFMF